ncbi:MAG: hypothetical protein ABS95_01345 [Verrucomicrobia bacterium SCN 57-15]|nr:MAG: hypothetical protein ABS95_01345 [Verrucomicrobia bacterium SCN 57-15]
MLSQQLESEEQSQRVRVEMESLPVGRRVKIRVENYEERLGWYTAGSLSLPLHQLPLLEQAVAEMRACESFQEDLSDKIIPIPESAFRNAG